MGAIHSGEGAQVASAGVVPTPAAADRTRTEGDDAGVVMSVSHNPFEDNGLNDPITELPNSITQSPYHPITQFHGPSFRECQ